MSHNKDFSIYFIYSFFRGSFADSLNSYFLRTYAMPGILGAREIMVSQPKISFPA